MHLKWILDIEHEFCIEPIINCVCILGGVLTL